MEFEGGPVAQHQRTGQALDAGLHGLHRGKGHACGWRRREKEKVQYC